MSHAPAPAPARPARQRTIGRRLLLLGQHILHHDNILITVIAVAMTLSAVAVYQATRAADEASDLLDQSRIVSAESSRQVGYLQTLVDHDLDVLRTYCTAEVQRDVARVSFLSYDPDLSALVTANLTLDGLRPLLLGDREADCAADAGQDYLMQRAAERLDNWQSGSDASSASGAELEAQAAIYHRDEAFLMTAGLLFAVVVAAIIAIDQLGSRRARPGKMHSRTAHRWQYGMLVLGALALATGLVLLVLFAVDMLLVVAIVVALAIAVITEAVWLRRKRASLAATAVDPGRHRSARPQWWAEMIGAVALIAFTASAVGLSLVSIQEREANARANRESSFALDLQRVGQQQALRALASLSFIAQMDAEEVTAQQLSAGDATVGIPSSVEDPASIEALRDVVDQRLQAADQDLRDQVASSSAAGTAADCDESAAGEAPLPSTLLGSGLGPRLRALVRARSAAAVASVRCDGGTVEAGGTDLVHARFDLHRRPGRARSRGVPPRARIEFRADDPQLAHPPDHRCRGHRAGSRPRAAPPPRASGRHRRAARCRGAEVRR